ncbi:hypothetical protein LLE49_17075 [Alicyclobacillus tolerans]|uniref:hypothetical protein n=1 Tax=Alicyclobacillus tolerans TaxID=90970 RepID=UPI001F2A3A72|nr:hypothetical protein [Alicyclobacillus tolerans]MCF8566437.1 hypothetical protein [Alicyclobacillus tolerans]
MNAVLFFLSRIPASIADLLVVGIGMWIYFRAFAPKDLRTLLADQVFNFLAVSIIVTRFSNLFWYPSSILHLNIWFLLSQPPQNGWVVGAVAGGIAVLVSLTRQKKLSSDLVGPMVAALVFSSLVYTGFRFFADSSGARTADLLRLIGSVVLMLWMRRPRSWAVSRPERMLAIFCAWLLLTSAFAVHVNKIGWLDATQWLYLLTLVGVLAWEASRDIRFAKNKTQS